MSGWLLIGGLMCVTAFLTLHAIGDRSLWLDEGLSARMAQLDPVAGINATYQLPTPGAIALYYLILHFWSTFGSDPTWLRSFSAMCVIAAVPVVYVLGSRLIGRTVGITAATVMGLSPFVVNEGQSARPYGLVILISTILTLILYSAIKGGGFRRWLLYAAVAAAGIYVHTTVAYLIAAQGSVAGIELVLCHRKSLRTFAERGAAAAMIVLAGLPLTGQFSAAGLAGVAPPSIATVTSAMTDLAGGRTLLAVTCLGIVALPLVGWCWLKRGRGLEFAILVAASIAPVALELAFSLLRPMFIDRYLAMAVPGLALVIGAAVDLLSLERLTAGTAAMGSISMRSTIARAAVLAVIAVLSLRSLVAPYTEQWSTAVQMVASEYRPGDGVIVYPGYAREPFDYYASKQPVFQDVTPLFPDVAWGQYFPASGPSLQSSLSTAVHVARVWVIRRSGDAISDSDAKLLASYLSCAGTIESNTTLQGVTVELVDFSPTPCPAGT